MAEAGAGILVFTIFWWTPGAWVFFDAEERDYSAYLWGAVSLVFGLLGVIVYFIVRSRRPATPIPYSRGRIYLHVGVLTAWGLVMVAVWSVLWGFLQWVGAEDAIFVDRDAELRESVAFTLAMLVIALPAFFVHLVLLRRRIAAAPEGSVRLALSRMQEGMAWLTVVVAGIVGAFGVTALVFGGVGSMLDVGGLSRDGGAAALSATLVAALSLLITFAVLFTDPEYRRGRTLREQYDATAARTVEAPSSTPLPSVAVATPQAASSSSEPSGIVTAFCAVCGTPRQADGRFCAGCGASFVGATTA